MSLTEDRKSCLQTYFLYDADGNPFRWQCLLPKCHAGLHYSTNGVLAIMWRNYVTKDDPKPEEAP